MGALDGLKILDFSTLFPGPFATMELADMGAEVIKIASKSRWDMCLDRGEYIEGTKVKGFQSVLLRNKKSVSLNFKSDEAKGIIKQLVKEYDIVVEQFRPGVMDRLGIGYETLREINPQLIYCALTGYGQNGPMAMEAGHDLNYLSRCGIVSYSGRPNQLPSGFGTQFADLAGGAENLMIGLLAAVISRNNTGKGQFVDVSMFDGALALTHGAAVATMYEGKVPTPESERTSGGSMSDYYETSDGRYIGVGAMEPKFYENFCNAIGCPELIEGGCMAPNYREKKKVARAAILKKTLKEWMAIFSQTDACVTPVQTYDEVLTDPHVKARNMFVELEIPGSNGVKITQLANPLKFSETPVEYRHAGPALGADTKAVITSLGYTEEDFERMESEGVFD